MHSIFFFITPFLSLFSHFFLFFLLFTFINFSSGSHLRLDSPALEFVNAVTHVMGLDGNLNNEISSLKRLLLSQVILLYLFLVFLIMSIFFAQFVLIFFFFLSVSSCSLPHFLLLFFCLLSFFFLHIPCLFYFSCLFPLYFFQLCVREFSTDSEFRDPALSYILRDVICSYCSTCR